MTVPEKNKSSIILGDCLDVLKTIPDSSVDCVITDPPFGIDYQNRQDTHQVKRKIQNDGNDFSYLPFASECFRVLKKDSAIFVFTGWSVYPNHFIQLQQAGFSLKAPLIVQKGQSGIGNMVGTFSNNADWILFGHKGSFKFRETRLIRNPSAGGIANPGKKPVGQWKYRFPAYWFGDQYPFATLNSSSRETDHPTEKNLRFLEWLILLATDEGQVVLDPFCGSGTTLLAAKQLKRQYIGIEIDNVWYEVAKKRIDAYYGFGL